MFEGQNNNNKNKQTNKQTDKKWKCLGSNNINIEIIKVNLLAQSN